MEYGMIVGGFVVMLLLLTYIHDICINKNGTPLETWLFAGSALIGFVAVYLLLASI